MILNTGITPASTSQICVMIHLERGESLAWPLAPSDNCSSLLVFEVWFVGAALIVYLATTLLVPSVGVYWLGRLERLKRVSLSVINKLHIYSSPVAQNSTLIPCFTLVEEIRELPTVRHADLLARA